jgi:hypothetical protein
VNGEVPTDDPISVNESIVDTMLKIPGLDREKILKVKAFSIYHNFLFLFVC